MNNDRRKFLQGTSLLATGYLLGKPLQTMAGGRTGSFLNRQLQLNAVKVIHTSDLHGKLRPFAFGDLNNIGGLYNIQPVVKSNGVAPVLVDAGGFLGGDALSNDDINMIRQMNNTGYSAVTTGDNELKNGEDYLASLMQYINFAVVNCNYSFSNPVLKSKIIPYHVVRCGQYKIGITGVGPLLNGSRYAGINFSNPYNKANEVAGYLKNQLNCNLVICLSHLGFEHKNGRHDNKAFAAASENIDIIAGGHDKNIAHPQLVLQNRQKKQVIISTGGYGGSILGSLTFGFDENRALQTFNCKNYVPGSGAGTSFHDNYTKLRA
jgi:5'-nucleotidase